MGQMRGGGVDRTDADHVTNAAMRALVDVLSEDAKAKGFRRFGCAGGLRCWRIESYTRGKKLLAFAAIGDEAVVADAHEARRQHV